MANTTTIQLGQTVYGGTVNATTGVLTVLGECIDLGDLTYTASSTAVSGKYRFQATLTSAKQSDTTNGATSICSCYELLEAGGTGNANKNGYTIGNSSNVIFYNEALATGTATEFKNAMAGQQLIYTYTTPQTIQLTPEQLTMLKGYNRLSSDGGGDLSITYKADRLAAIEAALAELQ